MVVVERQAGRGMGGTGAETWLEQSFARVLSFKDGRIWRVKEYRTLDEPSKPPVSRSRPGFGPLACGRPYDVSAADGCRPACGEAPSRTAVVTSPFRRCAHTLHKSVSA